jgi:hypothetical protein
VRGEENFLNKCTILKCRLLIWSVIASENEAGEENVESHLQLKRVIEPNHSDDVLGTSSFKHDGCKNGVLTLGKKFRPSARQLLQQLPIEIESNISNPEQVRFVLLRQVGDSFNTPILTDVRDGRDSEIAPPSCCA